MKKINQFLLVAMMALAPSLASAQAPTTMIYYPFTGPAVVNSQVFDTLLFDFSLTATGVDTMNTIAIRNLGSARFGYEVEGLSLYRDEGDGFFDGWGIDIKVATATYDYASGNYVFAGLNEAIGVKTNYYITLETGRNGLDNRVFNFEIPQYYDGNSNGAYDPGDMGIFLRTQTPLPDIHVPSSLSAYYRKVTDSTPPVSVIIAPKSSASITTTPYTITGQAMDQGGGVIEKHEVCIRSAGSAAVNCYPVTNTGVGYSTWTYAWSIASNGEYELYSMATDGIGNRLQSPSLYVTVDVSTTLPEVPVTPPVQPATFTNNLTYLTGRWVKSPESAAVYFLDAMKVRHAYPTQAVWASYFGTDFSKVETLTVAEIATYDLGRNVPFNNGSLIKINSIPKVYVVDNGILRWVTTEASAIASFGTNWSTKVKDLPEGFFTDYTVGVSW